MFEIEITAASNEGMSAHAVGTFPNECCGFFFGTSKNDRKLVTEIRPVLNVKKGDQRRKFSIDPFDYMKAEKYAHENQLELLGIYHSHPLHPANPSEHDLKQAMPFFSYIILSTQPQLVINITSWQLNENRDFIREELKISEPTNKYL